MVPKSNLKNREKRTKRKNNRASGTCRTTERSDVYSSRVSKRDERKNRVEMMVEEIRAPNVLNLRETHVYSKLQAG